jgi:uncharacterized protein (TIGR03083 family)
MELSEHIAAIGQEGRRIVAAAGAGRLDDPVPTCPGWTVRELVQHLGRTHLWAAAHVEQARPTLLSEEEQEAVWGDMPADPDVLDWYAGTNARLVAALEAAPADLDCWSFLPAPSPLAFWARRQAHEAAIHRADAEFAAGRPFTVSDRFALDGIDELLLGFFSRARSRLRSDQPRSLAVIAEGPDGTESWLLRIGAEGARGERGAGPADCTVRGPADRTYLALWNRAPLTELAVSGDGALLDLWTEKATVRWS